MPEDYQNVCDVVHLVVLDIFKLFVSRRHEEQTEE